MTRTRLDLERIRSETPGCRHVVHLNNAGAALMPRPVLDRVIAHLRRESEIGGYEAADEAREELSDVYGSIARLLNGKTHEVAVVENATRAWDMAFYALASRLRAGDRILTARAEYASNFIAFLQVADRTGARVEVVPDDDHGQLSVEALEGMIDERVALIAVTHVPTQNGLVNPAADIGRVARDADVPYLLDACQSAGQLTLDVEAIGCTALSATGRKYLRGPRGTGFLWVDETWIDRLEPPLLDLHSAEWTGANEYRIRDDARRFENWESNIAAKLGLGRAVDYALNLGIPAIEDRVVTLAEILRRRLADLPGVRVLDTGLRRCGIVTFDVDGHDPDLVVSTLRQQAVNCTVSRVASARHDLGRRGIDSLVRASVHYYNTSNELERLVSAIGAMTQKGMTAS